MKIKSVWNHHLVFLLSPKVQTLAIGWLSNNSPNPIPIKAFSQKCALPSPGHKLSQCGEPHLAGGHFVMRLWVSLSRGLQHMFKLKCLIGESTTIYPPKFIGVMIWHQPQPHALSFNLDLPKTRGWKQQLPSYNHTNLVGGFNPFEKYQSKWESSPNRGENSKKWNHHPVMVYSCFFSWICLEQL